MPRKPSPFLELRRRFDSVEERSRRYQAEGLPIPTAQFLSELEEAIRAGKIESAAGVVKRAEVLLARADQDWRWLNELLQRVDGLRGLAEMVGLDLARIDARVGNPRAQLLGEPLTPSSLERAAAGASFALAVLNDAVPKYVVAEAQALGVSIRRARDRGEDVRPAVSAFTALVRALQEPALAVTAERLVDARRAVARIPRAPPVAAISEEEEDEIIQEARNLARRLHRIRSRAHDATGAVRLMSQVRQALSEERRYASPEEEIEALWAEVDRLTQEKRLATAGPPLAAGAPLAEGDATTVTEPGAVSGGRGLEAVPTLSSRIAAPIEGKGASGLPRGSPAGSPAGPGAGRVPPPIVPPIAPLPDEGPDAPPAQAPDLLADGAGPRVPRPTRIAIAAAYVPPDLGAEATEVPSPSEGDASSGSSPAAGHGPDRRPRSRHRQD